MPNHQLDLPIPAELAVDEEPLSIEEIDALGDGHLIDDLSDDAPRALRWSITDDGAAEWAARRMAEAVGEIDLVTNQADEWVRRIEDWKKRRVAPLQSRARFFEANLEAYALRVREETGRASVPLPSATIRTTRSGARVVVVDDAGFKAWAEQNRDDAVVRVKYEPDASAIKENAVVRDEQIGQRYVASLSCQHALSVDVRAAESGAPPEWDDSPTVVCLGCDPKGAVTAKVEAYEVVPLIEAVIRHAATGQPLRWAGIKPESVSPKVTL